MWEGIFTVFNEREISDIKFIGVNLDILFSSHQNLIDKTYYLKDKSGETD